MYEEKILRFITCGGVVQLDTEGWELERRSDHWGEFAGPKPGEAGTDEAPEWD